MYRFTRIAAAFLTAGVLSVGLVGCTEHGSDAIPAQAETLTSGRGGDLIQARAPQRQDVRIGRDRQQAGLVREGQDRRPAQRRPVRRGREAEWRHGD